jgi:hypothetical protein
VESNAFKNHLDLAAEGEAPGDGTLPATVAVGLAAVVAAFVVDPFGRPVVMVSWGFVLGGLVLATVPARPRRLGFGLALAGAIPPFALFLWLWAILSVAVLGGAVS